MFNPVWKTPLETQLKDWQNAPNAGITISEWPASAYFMVRGIGIAQSMCQALGISSWPETPLTAVSENGIRVLWLSPDEWAVIGDFAQKDALEAKLLQGLGSHRGQVVDNCGGFTGLIVKGKDAEILLRHLTPYDVEHMTAGKTVGTVMSQTHVILSRLGAQEYEIIVRRSFADYLWKLIGKAARPYGLAVA